VQSKGQRRWNGNNEGFGAQDNAPAQMLLKYSIFDACYLVAERMAARVMSH